MSALQRLAEAKWNSFASDRSLLSGDAATVGLQHVIVTHYQLREGRRSLNVGACGIRFSVVAGPGPMDSGTMAALHAKGRLCSDCVALAAEWKPEDDGRAPCDYCRSGEVFRRDQNCPRCGREGRQRALEGAAS